MLHLLLAYLLIGAPAQPRAARKPVAYYCASGWRVKYHASPTCWGLRSCNARVTPITLARVKQERMEPCHVCH